MPTNLPPEYYEAEERYRAATTPSEKAERLEELLSTIPKHKGTDHLRADLRRKLSRLKSEAKSKKGAVRQVSPFHIDREGAGQVVVAGPPNTGKSALVNALTNATPEVAIHPYATWTPTPGMMLVENVQIQLIDTPPLSEEYVEPELLNLIRRADLLLLLLDIQAYPLQQLEDTVAFLENQRIVARQKRNQYPPDRPLISVPFLVLVNKCDDESWDGEFEILCELLEGSWSMLPISATEGRNLDQLRWAIFDELGIMRVYAKPPGREADLSAPFVLPEGSSVQDFAGKVHKDFLENLKSARVWGTGVHDGQMVGRDHILHEGDIVELRT
jgi:ribosome-interacting GTPase 1